MKIINMAVLAVFCLFFGINLTYAENTSNGWRYEITPYLLAAGIDGTIGISGYETDIDVPFTDILDDLDAGFMGQFIAHKGPWAFAFDGAYLKLEGDTGSAVKGPLGMVSINGELDITNSMYIAQGTAGYRILDGKTKVYAFGAVRYTEIEVELDVKVNATPPILNGSLSEDGTERWTDALVGLQVLYPVSQKVELVGYVDVGAGGSDLTYQFMGGVNWEFSEGFRAKVGYRYLYWDYEDDGFKWDVDASGPYLGLGIRF